MRVEIWTRRWWRGEAGPSGRLLSGVAWPLEGAFRAAVRARNLLYDRGILREHRAPVPVLAVGNLTVGGTGKTPVAAWWAARLVEAGRRPALVARGYGRDELLLHARWNPAVPVVAAPDRVEGARRAAEQGADVVVLDDGFQHRRLARDVDVVLLAAETPFPGRRLPRGPYREGPSALARADLVVVTRKGAPEAEAVALAERIARRLPGTAVARAVLAPVGWQRLDGSPVPAPDASARPVVVATAVGDPESVVATVRAALAHAAGPGEPVPAPTLRAFPDHHEFTGRDVRDLVVATRDATLVVTEKDAVKLGAWQAELVDARVLALEVRWEAGEDEVERLLGRLSTPLRGAEA
jgi:tetraacyldisaccharide 4'-kinase